MVMDDMYELEFTLTRVPSISITWLMVLDIMHLLASLQRREGTSWHRTSPVNWSVQTGCMSVNYGNIHSHSLITFILATDYIRPDVPI
jgi:hypothetical protein